MPFKLPTDKAVAAASERGAQKSAHYEKPERTAFINGLLKNFGQRPEQEREDGNSTPGDASEG